MTDEELKAEYDRRRLVSPVHAECIAEKLARADAYSRAEKAEDEVRRLRGLVKQAEWTTRNAAENIACAFGCRLPGASRWKDQMGHADDCPAFTPDGEVR